VTAIWHHFHSLVTIIRKDPEPVLKTDSPKGSLQETDYKWGYSDEDRTRYRHHAECFYQLYSLMYSASDLTPYMMKFIDQGPLLMDSLPFSVGRFQSEGGEHANYVHNCYFYQHTTRNGGRDKLDPMLALFQNMWRNLRYTITHQNPECPAAKQSGTEFLTYCSRHTAAVTVQRAFGGYFVRKYGHEVDQPKHGGTKSAGLFCGKSFVLVGAIPKIHGVKHTQDTLAALLKKNGASVRTCLPVKEKCSTKMFYIIASPAAVGRLKVPQAIRTAIHRNYPILKHEFLLECINEQKWLPLDLYSISVKNVAFVGTRAVSLAAKHFSKVKSMISHMKTRQKSFTVLNGKTKKKWTTARNPALFYAFKRRTQILKTNPGKCSFMETRQMLVDLVREWKTLPLHSQEQHRHQWRVEQQETRDAINLSAQNELDLEEYNRIDNPAYRSCADIGSYPDPLL
jgi:hypothetical protein